MRRSPFAILLVTIGAASCGDAHQEEALGRTTSALGAPAKLKTFTTTAAATTYGIGDWVDVGGKSAFVAKDLLHGKELWVTDGTTNGTSLLADAWPGAGDALESYMPHLFVSNGAVAVYAASTPEGAFAWRTDGTIAGTYALRSVPLQYGAAIFSGTSFGGSIFFSDYASNVWKTDGTDAGSTKFWSGGSVYAVVAGTTKLFLASGARPECPDVECLFVTDGTAIPQKVDGATWPTNVTTVGDIAFFSSDLAKGELWKSDGTSATLVDTMPGPISGMRVFGAGVLFLVDDLGVGTELWKSDGTTAELVASITPTPNDAYVTFPTVVGQQAFFSAYGAATGFEMWVTDGTTSGTKMIVDLFPGDTFGATVPQAGPAKFKNGVAFSGYGPTTGKEPYVTSGTAQSTMPVANVAMGATSSYPYASYHEGAGQTLLFAAPPAGTITGADLWASSVVGAATKLRAIDAPTAPAPTERVVLGNKMYFTTVEESATSRLWVSDGTAAGTLPVTPNGVRTNVQGLAVMGGKIYFSARTPADGTELWASDGTEAGTSMIDIYLDGGSSYPYGLTASGTHLFFGASDGTVGQEPHSYSVADGVVALGDLAPGLLSSYPSRFAAFAGGALFSAASAQWFSDGTAAGTAKISDVPSTSQPAVLGNVAFYGANDGLWKTDGTAASTTKLKSSLAPVYETVAVGGYVYFAGDSGSLWRSDGTSNGTTQVIAGLYPHRLFAFGTKLIFVGTDATSGQHWYASDGTAAGTKKLAAAAPGVCTPFVAESTLYLCAADDAGEELWLSDGTPAGTKRWMDLNAGPYRAAPDNFALLGKNLLFTAYEGVSLSLYVADVTATTTPPSNDAGASSGASNSGGASGTMSSSSTSSGGSSGSTLAADADGPGESGCGCRTVPSGRSFAWPLSAIAVGLLASRRRRKVAT